MMLRPFELGLGPHTDSFVRAFSMMRGRSVSPPSMTKMLYWSPLGMVLILTRQNATEAIAEKMIPSSRLQGKPREGMYPGVVIFN
jgi:hypothetical protein